MREDQHTLVGAYALDALPDSQRRRFERHLDRCESCRQDVLGLQETTARLGAAAAEPAPPDLRARVFAQVERTRQVRPRPAAVPLRSRFALPSWPPRLAISVLAACAAVIVVLGVGLVRTQGQLDEVQARDRAIAAVLSAEDARVVSATVRTGGSGTAVASRIQDAVVFSGSALDRLPASQDYELWFMGQGDPRPAAVMQTTASGGIQPVVASGLGGATQLGLTVEPAGGSPQPTTTPIFAVDLEA